MASDTEVRSQTAVNIFVVEYNVWKLLPFLVFYIHPIDSSSSTFGRKFNFSPCKQAWKTKTGFLRGKGCTSDQTFYESEFHLFSFSYSLQKYAFCESDLKTSVRFNRQSH